MSLPVWVNVLPAVMLTLPPTLPMVLAAAVVWLFCWSRLWLCLPMVTLRPPPLIKPDFFVSLKRLLVLVFCAATMLTFPPASRLTSRSASTLEPLTLRSCPALMLTLCPPSSLACAVVLALLLRVVVVLLDAKPLLLACRASARLSLLWPASIS